MFIKQKNFYIKVAITAEVFDADFASFKSKYLQRRDLMERIFCSSPSGHKGQPNHITRISTGAKCSIASGFLENVLYRVALKICIF